MELGAEQAAQKHGVQLKFTGSPYADNGVSQSKFVRRMMRSGAYDALALVPADAQALVGEVEDLVARGVPVVIVDSPLAKPDLAAYLGTDNYAAGEEAARQMAALVRPQDHVHVFRLVRNSASTEQRAAGFTATLKRLSPTLRVTDSKAMGLVDSAVRNARSVFKAHPDIDAIFAVNESTSVGVVKALRDSGLAKKPTVIAFDLHPLLLDALQQGLIHRLVIQSPEEMGARSIDQIVAMLRGNSLQAVVNTPIKILSRKTLDPWLSSTTQ
jgi:ribose transport system substrate-binding protein